MRQRKRWINRMQAPLSAVSKLTRRWRVPAAVVMAGLLLGSGPARAQVCSMDVAPAATLLLPYFEVDLDDPSRTTLFTVGNASAESTLAHVTVWSDLGVPTVCFPIYLTGYDVQSLNLRDLIVLGRIPGTGTVTSPRGPLSGEHQDFEECFDFGPFLEVPAAILDHIQSSLTGQPSPLFSDQCASRPHGDRVTRGYVTIDQATRCSPTFPTEPGYFGPDGVAGYDNVLWGEFIMVDSAGGTAQGQSLVHLQADQERFGTSGTFYGRYSSVNGLDAREPLPDQWATRYLAGGPFDGGTDLLVWQETGMAPEPFDCATRPEGFPAVQQTQHIILFDEMEQSDLRACFFNKMGCSAAYFPRAANRVPLGAASGVSEGDPLPAPAAAGWLWMDLSSPSFPVRVRKQTWLGSIVSAEGRFSLSLEGTPLTTFCTPTAVLQPATDQEAGR